MIRLENKTNGRYYHMTMQRDIISSFVLCIRRGGPKKNFTSNLPFESPIDCMHKIEELLARRIRRGYTIVTR